MTVYVDPVIGAAVVHLGLPILPALPCPTCRGTGWRCRNSNLMCTHRVHQGCPDCNGSGVWTPPHTSHPPRHRRHPPAWPSQSSSPPSRASDAPTPGPYTAPDSEHPT